MSPGLQAPAPWYAGLNYLRLSPADSQALAAAMHIFEAFLKQANNNITVGKYLISPLPKRLENGWWAISVSIRSGSGSGTHDRVLRLTRLFRTKLAAAEYAIGEGLQWIGHRPAYATPV